MKHRYAPAWIVMALVAWTINPLALFITLWPTGVGRRDCAGAELPPGCPREGLVWLAGMMMLLVWLIGTGLAAFAVGVVAGCHHYFAQGAAIPAVLAGVAMPWGLAAYALGSGLGHLATRVSERR